MIITDSKLTQTAAMGPTAFCPVLSFFQPCYLVHRFPVFQFWHLTDNSDAPESRVFS